MSAPADDIQKALQTIVTRLSPARATVHVTAAALRAGQTDLESLAAETLRMVADTLDEIQDDLYVIGHGDAKPEPSPTPSNVTPFPGATQ